jgi:hypothetical protein
MRATAGAANLRLARRLGWTGLAARMEAFLCRVAGRVMRASV